MISRKNDKREKIADTNILNIIFSRKLKTIMYNLLNYVII